MVNPPSSFDKCTETSLPDDTQKNLYEGILHIIGKFRLRTVLTVSLVTILILAMGITGFLTFFNSQYAIDDLAGQLQNEVSERIEQHLDTYLETPHLINQICANFINLHEMDINDQENLKRTFQKLSYQFTSVTSICFGNEQNGNYSIISVVGKPGFANGTERFWAISPIISKNSSYEEYRIDQTGKIVERTLSYPHYDPRTRSWYQAAVKAGGPSWTPIIMWLEVGAVSMDGILPVYSDQNHFLGVLDTSLTLTDIGDYLQSLQISRNGQAYIIEKSGEIVASSTIKEPYSRVNGELVRQSAPQSTNFIIQKSSQEVMNYINTSENLTTGHQFYVSIDNERYYVQVTPYQGKYGLDWFIVVVIPESDFMGKIYSNNELTALLFIVAVIGTIILCIYLARWITEPISAMNQSAKALTRGEWKRWKELDRCDELGELAHSFKQMAEQLHESFKSLKSSEERYLDLFQSSSDAILLFDGLFLAEINQTGEEMFGISQEDSNGKDIREVFGTMGSDLIEMIESCNTSLNSGFQDQTISRSLDMKEQFVNIRLKKVLINGKYLFLIHIRDITDQRRAILAFAEQESLRESYSQIEMILRYLPDPTFVIDLDGSVLFWNNAIEKMTGVKAEKIIGQKNYVYSEALVHSKRPILIDLALHPELPYKDLYPNLEHTGDVLWATSERESSGEMRYYSALAACLYDKKGTVVGAIESIRDITSHKNAEEALLTANKKLKLLSNITHHDIVNKVALSKGCVYFLRIISLTNEQEKTMVSLDHSLTGIEQIIEFTKTYQELGLNVPTWQNVREIFKGVISQLDPGEISVTITIEDFFVYADPLFEKVCYNLIENSLRHGEYITQIDITAEEIGTDLVIIVQDNGPGVLQDEKELIFEKGFGKNNGYGLFLSKEILSLSNITIVECGEYGAFARFEIKIPKGRFNKK